jgi:hypothetical protein
MRTLPGVLKIFVTTGCRGCKRTQELAEWVREVEPRLEVQVMDLSVEPDAGGNLVFAVPTYVYGDQAIFLGNPSPGELKTWLDSLHLEV